MPLDNYVPTPMTPSLVPAMPVPHSPLDNSVLKLFVAVKLSHGRAAFQAFLARVHEGATEHNKHRVRERVVAH